MYLPIRYLYITLEMEWEKYITERIFFNVVDQSRFKKADILVFFWQNLDVGLREKLDYEYYIFIYIQMVVCVEFCDSSNPAITR